MQLSGITLLTIRTKEIRILILGAGAGGHHFCSFSGSHQGLAVGASQQNFSRDPDLLALQP